MHSEQARIAELEQQLAARDAQIAELEKQIQELREQVGRNSRNSHLPPSSDPPGNKNKNKRERGKRKRGGQPGRLGRKRELLPPEQVDEVFDFYPDHCEKCRKPLPETPDPAPWRFQVAELPVCKPHITEYRRHEVKCACGHRTCAAYHADEIPPTAFGPRLMATIAMLTGVYHLSRRAAQSLLAEIAGVRISLGGLSTVEARVAEALEPAVDEAWKVAKAQAVKHTDGTSWRQSGVVLALWTIASTLVTVFKIVTDGRKETLKPLYGELKGILVSDRATSLNFWAMDRRQICWAHLLRKFVSFSERDGPAGAMGKELLGYTGVLFEYWHDYKDGKLGAEQFRAWMTPLREQIERVLERGAKAKIARVSGSCANILEHKVALWTFVDHDGVEPTNNHAERELRAFVLWRRRSFGTQSERGNRFAERVMTVAHTARKQGRNVLEFLTETCKAKLGKAPSPSLFSADSAA